MSLEKRKEECIDELIYISNESDKNKWKDILHHEILSVICLYNNRYKSEKLSLKIFEKWENVGIEERNYNFKEVPGFFMSII